MVQAGKIRADIVQRSLSIPEWHQMVAEGCAPPVRIQLGGYSMFPLVRYQKDYVTVIPLETAPFPGDIVLFADPSGDRYVMHRVMEIKDGEALTWGDNCDEADGWIPLSEIWGKALQVERGRLTIRMDAGRGLRWASFWHRVIRMYRPPLRVIRRTLGKIKNPEFRKR